MQQGRVTLCLSCFLSLGSKTLKVRFTLCRSPKAPRAFKRQPAACQPHKRRPACSVSAARSDVTKKPSSVVSTSCDANCPLGPELGAQRTACSNPAQLMARASASCLQGARLLYNQLADSGRAAGLHAAQPCASPLWPTTGPGSRFSPRFSVSWGTRSSLLASRALGFIFHCLTVLSPTSVTCT